MNKLGKRKNISEILEYAGIEHFITAQAARSRSPRLTEDINISVKPTPENLRRLAEIIKRFRLNPKILVKLENFLSKRSEFKNRRLKNKNHNWSLLSKKELYDYSRVSVADKLNWLQKVRDKVL